MKISWPSVAAAVTTAFGIVLSPAVLGALNPHVAGVIVAIGGLWSILTKPIVHDPATGAGPVSPSK